MKYLKCIPLWLLCGCTVSSLEKALPPSSWDMKQAIGTAIDTGVTHFDALSKQHQAMSPETKGLDIIQAQAAQTAIALRAEMLAQQGSIVAMVQDKINPLTEQLFGIPFLIEEVKKDTQRSTISLGTRVDEVELNIKENEVKIEIVLRNVREQIVALNASQKHDIINSILGDENFELVMQKFGFTPAHMAEIKEGLPEDKNIRDWLLEILGIGGGATAVSRLVSKSGKRIDKLEENLAKS